MQSFNQNVIKHKTGLLNLAAELGNISQACRIMGFSRDTFYRYQTARDSGGIEALFDANRRKPNLKNRVALADVLHAANFGQARFEGYHCNQQTRCPSTAQCRYAIASVQCVSTKSLLGVQGRLALGSRSGIQGPG